MRLLVTAMVVGVLMMVPAGRAVAQEAFPTADLAILSITANVKHAKVGQEVTFTIVAINNGPQPAIVYVDISRETSLTYVGITTPGALEIVGAECDHGVSGDGVFCEYGVIAPGETLTQTFVGKVLPGTKRATNTACIPEWLDVNDPNPANDCAAATVKIIGKRH